MRGGGGGGGRGEGEGLLSNSTAAGIYKACISIGHFDP